jgi:hypothetical protein
MGEREPVPEERPMGEREPVPEAKSIEGKSDANKPIAVEREGTGPHEAASHEAAGACKIAPTKATAKGRPTKAAAKS